MGTPGPGAAYARLVPAPVRTAVVGVAALLATLALAGCGGGEDRVALAVQGAERQEGVVLLTVECAAAIEVEQRPDPEGSGLQQVTVWGSPETGTCHPDVRLDDLAEDRFVDGASSQVVTVAPEGDTD